MGLISHFTFHLCKGVTLVEDLITSFNSNHRAVVDGPLLKAIILFVHGLAGLLGCEAQCRGDCRDSEKGTIINMSIGLTQK